MTARPPSRPRPCASAKLQHGHHTRTWEFRYHHFICVNLVRCSTARETERTMRPNQTSPRQPYTRQPSSHKQGKAGATGEQTAVEYDRGTRPGGIRDAWDASASGALQPWGRTPVAGLNGLFGGAARSRGLAALWLGGSQPGRDCGPWYGRHDRKQNETKQY